MSVIDTCIYDRDDDVGIARAQIPGFGGVDIGVFGAARLSYVVQRPLLGITRIVRSQEESVLVVRLGVIHVVRKVKLNEGIQNIRALRQLDRDQTRCNVIVFFHDGRPGDDRIRDRASSDASGPRSRDRRQALNRPQLRICKTDDKLVRLVG